MPPAAGEREARPSAAALASLLDAPLRFEPNRGQFERRVRFAARGPGYALAVTGEGATLALPLRGNAGRHQAMVAMRFVGGRSDVEPIGEELQPSRSNYFIGDDSSRWRTNIETYGRVHVPSALPGVDVDYYATGRHRLEYDVTVAPNVDPRSVEIAFDGAESVSIDSDGAAVLALAGGAEIVQPAPVAYQVDAAGDREAVSARYELRAGALAFAVGPYDHERAVVIDPMLVYSTYLGGSSADQVNAIAVDSAGEVFVTGFTQSFDFPTASPFQPALAGGTTNAFVAKVNATGSALVYSTYLGGNVQDVGQGIAIDGAGEVFVTGFTQSTNFPTASPIQPKFAGNIDGFVAKLDPTGSTLVYSTYLGGRSVDQANGIAVDSAGEAFVTGVTGSTDFPVASPFQAHNAFGDDAFVAKLSATGSALVYSTYLGGHTADQAFAVAVDSAGEALVTGYTTSTDFPTASPLQASNAGGFDVFVTKFGASGSALVFSTYLGGTGDDIAQGIATDLAGEAFVAGYTSSTNFPTASAFLAYAGNTDAFVSKIAATGSTLAYSTYIGGSAIDVAQGIVVNGVGEAFVTGYTQSPDFPTLSPMQFVYAGAQDAFVAKLNPHGTQFAYSSYLGGTASDTARGIAVNVAGEAFVGGGTQSIDFPSHLPLQGANAGGPSDGFVTKISAPPSTAAPALGGGVFWLAGLLVIVGVLRARRVRLAVPSLARS
jgi:hypothetical protein